MDQYITLLVAFIVPFILLSVKIRMSVASYSKVSVLNTFLRAIHRVMPLGFGSLLDLPKPHAVSDDNAVTVKMKVPPHLCQKNKGMPLSVLMSLFDDISTWSAVTSEPKKRPGVSVHLSARWAGDISPSFPVLPPSRPILIESRLVKRGRVLSFMEVRLDEERRTAGTAAYCPPT